MTLVGHCLHPSPVSINPGGVEGNYSTEEGKGSTTTNLLLGKDKGK